MEIQASPPSYAGFSSLHLQPLAIQKYSCWPQKYWFTSPEGKQNILSVFAIHLFFLRLMWGPFKSEASPLAEYCTFLHKCMNYQEEHRPPVMHWEDSIGIFDLHCLDYKKSKKYSVSASWKDSLGMTGWWIASLGACNRKNTFSLCRWLYNWS